MIPPRQSGFGRRPAARPAQPGSGRSAGGGVQPTFVQQVADPGFDVAGSWTLGGSGIGTSAVAGGVLQITSTDNLYTAVPATVNTPLPIGNYSVTYTILNYASGSIAIVHSASADLSSSTDGTIRSGNGTFTQTLGGWSVPRYIGLKGQGAAVVNSMQIDNMTITRVS